MSREDKIILLLAGISLGILAATYILVILTLSSSI